MSSYVVTGSSKGLGYAFLENLAKNPANTVIGLARSKTSLEAKLQEAGITNVHVLQGDVNDLGSLKAAAEATSTITGGKLDVLINNAGLVSQISDFKTILDFDSALQIQEDDFLESFKVNALGLVNVVHAFLPLVRQGRVKKVVNLSTGIADLNLIHEIDFDVGAPYAASKAAANVIIAKYAAALKKEGILFLSLSPGYVSTEANLAADPVGAQAMGMKFASYAPHFTRPLTPEESVTAMLEVVNKKSVANGDSGTFISHLGTQQWL